MRATGQPERHGSVRRAGGLRRHLRCSLAVVSSYLFGNEAFLRLIGGINRVLLRGRIKGVFLLYPARQAYADALAYRWHQRRFAWCPGLVGAYRQDGGLGLIFGIPDLEEKLRDEDNGEHVLGLMRKMERVRQLVGAERKIFAGILPSRFAKLGVADEQLEQQRELTARAVVSALDQVVARTGVPRAGPIVLIGGKGYIASKVFDLCRDRSTYTVDIGEFDTFRRLAQEAHGGAAVVINLAKSTALAEYTEHFWPGVVVLNEVYPEPDETELAALAVRGVRCFHVVGVAGRAWPRFPRAYRGGIPCCAALPVAGSTDVTALVSELVAPATRRAT
jgi:hypothetical protein